jgi:hypothetical protein
MSQAYSNPTRENDPHALPDIEVFQLTATEVAGMDEDLIHEYMREGEYRLAGMNGRVREKMLDEMVLAEGIKGGWFWWMCFPGCIPDGDPVGPFDTHAEALADAQNLEG